jgi:hypothetical protein
MRPGFPKIGEIAYADGKCRFDQIDKKGCPSS